MTPSPTRAHPTVTTTRLVASSLGRPSRASHVTGGFSANVIRNAIASGMSISRPKYRPARMTAPDTRAAATLTISSSRDVTASARTWLDDGSPEAVGKLCIVLRLTRKRERTQQVPFMQFVSRACTGNKSSASQTTGHAHVPRGSDRDDPRLGNGRLISGHSGGVNFEVPAVLIHHRCPRQRHGTFETCRHGNGVWL